MTKMIIVDGPDSAPATLILAHGAGAGMDTEFMNAFAEGLADHGFRVVRFEFPYMAERRQTGKRRPPDREPVLRQTWLDVIALVKAETLFIGGKSLGSRIASLIADGAGVGGLICLGYPFHPIGKPDQLRVEHLRTIKTSTLILRGERGPFGNTEEVRDYELSRQIRVHWLPDGALAIPNPRPTMRSRLALWFSNRVLRFRLVSGFGIPCHSLSQKGLQKPHSSRYIHSVVVPKTA